MDSFYGMGGDFGQRLILLGLDILPSCLQFYNLFQEGFPGENLLRLEEGIIR